MLTVHSYSINRPWGFCKYILVAVEEEGGRPVGRVIESNYNTVMFKMPKLFWFGNMYLSNVWIYYIMLPQGSRSSVLFSSIEWRLPYKWLP